MKLTFIKNNYLIIWNLLYGSSISMKTKAFKQKLWITYKKEYKAIENDKEQSTRKPCRKLIKKRF